MDACLNWMDKADEINKCKQEIQLYTSSYNKYTKIPTLDYL